MRAAVAILALAGCLSSSGVPLGLRSAMWGMDATEVEPSPPPPLPTLYIVTFSANGGKVGEARRQVEKGAALGELPTPTRKGYAFKGWWTAKSGGAKIKATTKVTKSVTYYARWAANKYTIKFHKNGGKGKMKSLSATYDKSVKLTANAFKRSKHTFLGWAKTKSGEVAYKNKASVKNLTATNGKVVTLYAVWKPYSYTVKFNANGGKGAATKQTVICGAKTRLAKNVFKREGFVFAGWATTKGGPVVYKNKANVKDLAKKGKSVTLYAVWKPEAWAVGTFSGEAKVRGKAATATLTVSSLGKISGKFVSTKDKKTYSFSVDEFDGFSKGALRVSAPVKYGSTTYTLDIAVGRLESDDGSGVGGTIAALEISAGGNVYAGAQISAWKPAKWAVGTFDGDAEVRGKEATATLFVSAAGELSGEFVMAKDGKTYPFTIAGFGEYSDGAFRATSPVKYGSTTYKLDIAVLRYASGGGAFAEIEISAGGKVYASAEIPKFEW